ncbi:hypothetical protein RhiirC2_721079, partial [Rhizophagus irregularis]
EEKIKKSVDPNNYDDEILKGLETTKRNYLAQIEIIKKAIDSNDPSMPPILPDDIAELEQKLYDLPINGQTLRKIKDEAKRGQTSKGGKLVQVDGRSFTTRQSDDLSRRVTD